MCILTQPQNGLEPGFMLAKLFRELVAGRREQNAGFLPHYEREFAPLLAWRTDGFRLIFEQLEARCKASAEPALIVETGSMRKLGSWSGDGQSTLLWKEFAAYHTCEIHTVDLDPAAGDLVREQCGKAVHAHTGDSIAYLHGLATAPAPRQIDLLYLDSFDFHFDDPFPSAFHHVKELIAVRPCLRKGSIVAIDDNFKLPSGEITGKGYLASQWFRDAGIKPLYEGYQFIWQF